MRVVGVGLMQKVNVIGTSGSGKTTFSRQLAAKLQCTYIEMDALYWKPAWQESTDEEFFERLEEALKPPKWVLDGNYQRTAPIKWAKVDTIIWLDYGFARTLLQAIKRALVRSITKRELWAGTGNYEKFRISFFSRKSIILWTMKTYYSNRKRYTEVMQNPRYQHIRFVRLTSPSATRAFLERGTTV